MTENLVEKINNVIDEHNLKQEKNMQTLSKVIQEAMKQGVPYTAQIHNSKEIRKLQGKDEAVLFVERTYPISKENATLDEVLEGTLHGKMNILARTEYTLRGKEYYIQIIFENSRNNTTEKTSKAYNPLFHILKEVGIKTDRHGIYLLKNNDGFQIIYNQKERDQIKDAIHLYLTENKLFEKTYKYTYRGVPLQTIIKIGVEKND